MRRHPDSTEYPWATGKPRGGLKGILVVPGGRRRGPDCRAGVAGVRQGEHDGGVERARAVIDGRGVRGGHRDLGVGDHCSRPVPARPPLEPVLPGRDEPTPVRLEFVTLEVLAGDSSPGCRSRDYFVDAGHHAWHKVHDAAERGTKKLIGISGRPDRPHEVEHHEVPIAQAHAGNHTAAAGARERRGRLRLGRRPKLFQDTHQTPEGAAHLEAHEGQASRCDIRIEAAAKAMAA